ncbi:6-hydroxymethylpterin diphosphokinase MptE-like protein [Methanotorris igneus]|uniref:6-hydroxymethyl-7,8-dihydropterin pyrophosphokinase n=1 Tax=Methanotorris igneus (strain DSM 5666 / JCM 11834 / Kol 5) TaxID=880724 RepID=F6BCX9_METIK|nr:6-hydroxymethylpterin diphosphokinase MptE-like protein [Methanotorris igneus]AEF96340.1 protein of unknown function DUF115 [Methanotorris igneus Kol 5]
MDMETWKEFYNKIMDDFRFDKEKDVESAIILNEIIEKEKNNIDIEEVKKLISGKEVYVFGAGPSLKKHVKIIKEKNTQNPIIAADGATKALLEEGIVPNIIISDLDGDINSIIEANKKGAIVVIHAHGDNIDKIKEYARTLKNIIGSTQIPHFEQLKLSNLINYGGFTDGDRCCFLAEHLEAKKIILCGMDFGIYVTKYSRPNIKNDIEIADDIKQKKLKYAEELVHWLKIHGKSEIVYLE